VWFSWLCRNTWNGSDASHLFFSPCAGYGDIVVTLCDAGADVNVQNLQGESALDAAEQEGYTRIVLLLKVVTMSILPRNCHCNFIATLW